MPNTHDDRDEHRLPPLPADAPTRKEWGKQPVDSDERKLLEGPDDRGSEFLRVLRIAWEFIRGFRALTFVGPCVTVFGSARFTEEHPYYQLTREVSAAIAREGFTIMTGGGPGLMEAANRGARDAGAHSVGVNILLPLEQAPNPYLDTFVDFRYFFVRKVMLAKYSYAFVAMPGGFGTMDELFEIATLIQTGKIRNYPCILVGVEYWQPLVDFMRERLVSLGTIDPHDLDRFVVTDSPAEVAAHVRETSMARFGLRYRKKRPLRRRRFLFE
jgi:uncharacterized protein (TIGR00730 family)